MFRVLLVDDEPRALMGLQKYFQWDKHGFAVIAAVLDPTEALEILKNQRPDVVFTDIKMPALTGVQLMQKARELGLDTEFILVSGYAEFSYARDALHAGAFDYCLKPLDLEEADRLLARLHTHLRGKLQRRDAMAFLRLMESRPGQEALERAQALGLPCRWPIWQAFVALHPTGEEPRLSLGSDADMVTLRLSDSKTLMLVNSAEPLGLPEHARGEEGSSLGCSLPAAELNAARLYREADVSANKPFVTACQGNQSYRPRQTAAVNAIVGAIQRAFQSGDTLILARELKAVPAQFLKADLGVEDAVLLWNRTVALCTGEPRGDQGALDLDFLTYDQMLNEYPDLGALCNQLLCGLGARAADAPRGPSEAENQSFRQLLRYVNEHAHEKLYLRDLSRQFYLNESYCCILFKKVTGTSFSEYLMKLRLQKANRLLTHGNTSIGEIAKAVGYDDCYYFSRIYKKFFGQTATQHRRQLQQDEQKE